MTSDGTLSVIPGQAAGMDQVATRLVAAMPLHAITVMYGEPGLRGRLLLETSRFPAADQGRVRAALDLAARLHAGDRRQREPYISHPLRVAIRILSHYRASDPDVACAALLHDSVEDHADDIAPGGARHEALAILGRRFGARTADLVAAVTNPVWDPGRETRKQYREHVVASLEASPWARVVKLSDFTDNAVGLIHTNGPKLLWLAAKYRPLIPVLRELALRADTPLDPEVKAMIAGQLDTAAVRLSAIAGDDDTARPLRAAPADMRPRAGTAVPGSGDQAPSRANPRHRRGPRGEP